MGAGVGDGDGSWVTGAGVSSGVGSRVGFRVGAGVGSGVGSRVGSGVGSAVPTIAGSSFDDGREIGCAMYIGVRDNMVYRTMQTM